MVEVVSPSGTRIVYNRGRWLKWHSEAAGIYDGDPDNGGKFIARVPRTWVISFDNACKIEAYGKVPAQTAQNALDIVLRAICSFKGYQECEKLSKIKLKLRNFDARSNCWKR